MSKHKHSFESDIRDSQRAVSGNNNNIGTGSWSNIDMEIISCFRQLTLEQKSRVLASMIAIKNETEKGKC